MSADSYDYLADPENRLPWHWHGWEEDEEREGVEVLTIAERVEWHPEDATPGAETHVTYEEAAVIVHRSTDHPDSERWREQKEALGERMCALLNAACSVERSALGAAISEVEGMADYMQNDTSPEGVAALDALETLLALAKAVAAVPS
jgi:hypothetical protein